MGVDAKRATSVLLKHQREPPLCPALLAAENVEISINFGLPSVSLGTGMTTPYQIAREAVPTLDQDTSPSPETGEAACCQSNDSAGRKAIDRSREQNAHLA